MSKKRFLGTFLAICAAVLCACGEDNSFGVNAIGSNQMQTHALTDAQSDEQSSPGQPGTGNQATSATTCENADLQTSSLHCGRCGHACGRHETCENGECICNDGYLDCDRDGVCETYGECACEPGQKHDCYFGSYKTNNVGECKAGQSVCVTVPNGGGVYWDEMNCEGQILPSYDYLCDPLRPHLDLDCDGNPDAQQDDDGDGYAICNEAGDAILDCCDNLYMCDTDHPELIHPGRIDCYGNQIDDNCSGIPDDNAALNCDSDETIAETD